MRSLTLSLMLLFSSLSSAELANLNTIDPDLIDPEMTRVMYLIGPNDIKTTSYKSGHPSAFELKLCSACMKKTYQLKVGANLKIDAQPLAIEDLAINLIKKESEVIQLGIDRTTKTVTYIYLGGISELSTGEL